MFGSLLISQPVTLYLTPVTYLYLEVFQEKVLDRTPFFHFGHSQLPQEIPGTEEACI